MRVDTFLDVPADVTPRELEVAAESASAIPDDAVLEVEGGTLVDDSTNDLAAVAEEVREQQGTARASIAPTPVFRASIVMSLDFPYPAARTAKPRVLRRGEAGKLGCLQSKAGGMRRECVQYRMWSRVERSMQ